MNCWYAYVHNKNNRPEKKKRTKIANTEIKLKSGKNGKSYGGSMVKCRKKNYTHVYVFS